MKTKREYWESLGPRNVVEAAAASLRQCFGETTQATAEPHPDHNGYCLHYHTPPSVSDAEAAGWHNGVAAWLSGFKRGYEAAVRELGGSVGNQHP